MIHFTKKHLVKILKNKQRIFLFLDYDGTLTPIVRDPQSARIPVSTKKILTKLAADQQFVVGIISGRSLRDVKKRVGLKNILYAGNHGLELEYNGQRLPVEAKLQGKYKAVLKKAKDRLAKNLKNIRGVILEDKGVIIAVHYRKVDLTKQKRVIKIFKETIKPFLKTKLFKSGSGKKVLELRPNISFSKADSVKFFCKQFKKTKKDLLLFVGDDLTDEAVFKILNEPDLGVRIGRKQGSRAKYYLRNPQELSRLLGYILELS